LPHSKRASAFAKRALACPGRVQKLAAVLHEVKPAMDKRPKRTVGMAVILLLRQRQCGRLDLADAFAVDQRFVARR